MSDPNDRAELSAQQSQDPAPDDRFDFGLFSDVADVLKNHGYAPPEGTQERYLAYGNTMALLLRLCDAYEGRAES